MHKYLASCFIYTASLFGLTLLLAPGHIAAQEAIGLSISPPTFELSANPGEEVVNNIKVTNLTAQAQEVVVERRNFTAIGESGAVGLTEDETTYSLANWINVSPAQWVINAGESQTFEFTINVPVNAEPGGHFGSVVFRTGAKQVPNQTGAAVAQEVGSLVLLRVAGTIKEQAQFEEFTTTRDLYEYGPVDFDIRFKNNGNVHIKTRGSITISDLFGRDVAVIPLEEKNVLPDAVRRVDARWDAGWKFGKYNATVASNYGANTNEIITASATFFIVPYKMLTGVLIGLIILGFLMYRARYRIRRALRALVRGE